MAYQLNIREEEIKNRLRKDYFNTFNAEEVLGDIDFAVAVPVEGPQLFEPEYLLWAEAKKSNHHDIYESFVQLILTIGKARTFDNHLPPAFLGTFDAEKIAFIQYNAVLDIFYQNDFNWNVTPSNHETKEFRQIYDTVKGTLDRELLLFYFDKDDKELRGFIKKNFIVGKSKVSKVRINKNNFTAIYQKWLAEVKPTIANVNWETAKKKGIIDADFYLADILSEHNVTLREKLYVLLRKDYYELDRKIDDTGFFNSKKAEFNDGQKAHTQFWNRYDRPPKREYWDYIVDRRDLLVPQDVRERKGSFYTPSQWVELSQQYIAAELGENWQEEYYVWDCCAGTGNLLAGLTNKYHIWASTLDQADVDVMHDRINTMNEASSNGKNGANLLHDHVFQFDFLNDSFDKLPKSLQDVIHDPEKRKKLVIYINPPYAEAGSTFSKNAKVGVSNTTKAHKDYTMGCGTYAKRELFVQFFMRIYREIPSTVLAEFSKLKILQAPYFREFRNTFRAKLGRNFCVPADTFDNVNGQFPIGFFIWHLDGSEVFHETITDVYDRNGQLHGKKTLGSYDGERMLNDWLRPTWKNAKNIIGWLVCNGNDFQHQNELCILSERSNQTSTFFKPITLSNIIRSCIYLAVRHCIEATWLNDRDQFLFPNDGWKEDREFQGDCLAFTLFHGQNRISYQHGTNHFIPFTEQEVDARDNFSSHVMSDFIMGRLDEDGTKPMMQDFFMAAEPLSRYNESIIFSPEAQAVMDAGRELWRYYHSQENAIPDASFYDIRLHFQGTKTTQSGKKQMNPDSPDAHYTALIAALRQKQKALASKIAAKVYEYGFLKK